MTKTSKLPAPLFSRGQVNKAGRLLIRPIPDAYTLDRFEEDTWAYDVLSNWRACHNYPINTFQATLRNRLTGIDPQATVAQRLKRYPSILVKLRRYEDMKLARMQDIGGLRAIVKNVSLVRKLEDTYRKETASFRHKLVTSKDYIASPKSDGYRSVHLVYRYKNLQVPAYDGFQLELQIRSRLQHAWATAVETMGTFLGQALKSGLGERKWRAFFEVSSAALAHQEKTAPVPGYENLSRLEVYRRVAQAEADLHVLDKLRGFSVAATNIRQGKGQGSYHLVILNSDKKTVEIRPFSSRRLKEANDAYTAIEKSAQDGEHLEAVLVSAGPVEALKRAYPNFFLDTHEFIKRIENIIEASKRNRAHRPRRGQVLRKRAVTR